MSLSLIDKAKIVVNDRIISSWWRHQKETFPALLAICAGNSPVPGEFPAQRPVTRSLDVFFDLRTNNGWVKNGEAGDLRRHRAHCDVIVMFVMQRSWASSIMPHGLSQEEVNTIVQEIKIVISNFSAHP